MARWDPEEVLIWIVVAVAGCIGVVLVFAIGMAIAHAWRDSSDRSDCRAAGKQVITDKDGEWHCAALPTMPEVAK